MLQVKAHAKSVDGKTIQLILFNPATGAVISTHSINEAPTTSAPEGQMSGVQHVEAFLDKYHQSNPDSGVVAYTVENFAGMAAVAGSGLVEPTEEVASAQDIQTSTGKEPKIISKDDGSVAVQGTTLVLDNLPAPGPEAEATPDEEPGAPPTVQTITVKTAPPTINSLPNFMNGDPEWWAGLTAEEAARELQDYGSLLSETSLVAGSDFTLPSDFGQQGEDTPPESPEEPEPEPEEEAEQREEDPDAAPQASPRVKRAVQTEGISKEVEAKLATMSKQEANRNRGIGGDPIVEPVPSFSQTKTEEVISNKYNSWIVLGRDRAHEEKASRASGYGGIGHTQCGSIDMVVGRMAPFPRAVGEDGKRITVDPIFNLTKKGKQVLCDAARIYISQKTDVDKNFMLKEGKVGIAEARSAIALKADGVRIMAREGIKLVTHADRMNSQGGTITRVRGVDIIAGNQTTGPKFDLQPMVKGNNLRECIEEMSEVLSDVCGTVAHIITNMAELNVALSTHFHPSPFFGAPTMPSPTLMPMAIESLVKLSAIDTFSVAAQKFNIARIKKLYTGEGALKSIRSKHNNVN